MNRALAWPIVISFFLGGLVFAECAVYVAGCQLFGADWHCGGVARKHHH